uniref:Ig-like domain-containing protein n=1 Tax=Astatotilapia calliptera TaxID=8154 RepID=A0AAX7SU97_ASTCA
FICIISLIAESILISILRPTFMLVLKHLCIVDCVATGLPDPEVFWSLPDGTIINNALQSDDSGLRNRRHVMFGNGTLLLQQMGKKDEGDYTCYAKNKLGKDERKVSVKVGPNAPKIRFKSQSLVTIKLGESAKLSCEATGEPTPRITWISPQKDVIPASSDKFQIMDGGMLLVKKVTLSSEGIYTCLARNSAGDDVKNIKVEAEPQEPFINGVKGRSTTKVLGVSYQTAHLHCRVEGKPEPRVWWVTPYGLSLPAPYLGGRFQVHQNGTLELRGIRKTDEGRYMCLAKNNMGEASLLVEFDVASLAEKPTFSVPNIEILPIKPDGGELILECSARGNGTLRISRPASITWILPNGVVLDKPQTIGTYICKASNSFGSSALSYPVTVMVFPPQITSTMTSITRAYRGSPVMLKCVATGIPKPDISWTLPGRTTLAPHSRYTVQGGIHMTEEGSLVIQNPVLMNSGIYKCNAKNALGTDFKSTYLQVV